MRCAIHSANSGSVMVIPRENKLVRFYIQLTEVNANGIQIRRSQITPEMILKSARKIMKPFTLTYEYCDRWTAYQGCNTTPSLFPFLPRLMYGQIGQRVGNKFSADERIFLVGDAVHTHSPKVLHSFYQPRQLPLLTFNRQGNA